MSSHDHPPLQDSRSGWGTSGPAGLPTHPAAVAERPRDWTRQPQVMTEQGIPDLRDEFEALSVAHKCLSRVSKRWCRSQHQSVSSAEA
jgi:hypothetical protein